MSVATAECGTGQPRRASIQAGGTTLAYLEWGSSGKPILLLHGITSSARGWWRVAPELAERGYHVFAADMPGHGESGDTGDHRIDAIASIVGKLLELPALQDAIVIGHSWGGAVGLALANGAHGEPLPRRVVLVDPALQLDPNVGATLLASYTAGIGAPPEVTAIEVRAKNPDWHPCDIHWKIEALERCRQEAVEGFFTRSGRWDYLARLAEATMPLLLIVADPQFTVIRPEALVAAEQALRPGLGQAVIIPGSTHSVFRSSFEPFIQVLLPWLEAPLE